MRLGAVFVFATALGAATASFPATAPAKSPAAELVAGEGIFIVVRSTERGISFERVARARKPQISPAAGFVTTAGWERHPPGTETLIAGLYDKKGKLLGAYDFPVRRIAFADTDQGGGLQGGPRVVPSVELPLHVLYVPKAAFIYFWRTIIRSRAVTAAAAPSPTPFLIEGSGPYGAVAFAIEPLGALPLGPKLKDLPKLEVPLRLKTTPLFPPYIPDGGELKAAMEAKATLQHMSTVTCPSPDAIVNIGSDTDVATSFNIVILGDGYTTGEKTDFETAAQSVKDAIWARAPFSEFTTKINVFRVFTPSAASGVEYCPRECSGNPTTPTSNCRCMTQAPTPRATVFEVSGNTSGIGSCTDFASNFTTVHDMAACALDAADIDLTIVLVNCDAYGAYTYPTEKTIYVASGNAREIIVHEAGHAVAHLGEEYISGVLPCPSTSCGVACVPPKDFDNVALPADVAANTVSWLKMALPSELSSGTFATVERQPAGNCYGRTGTPNGLNQTLGLYWGAQYLADGPDPINPGDPACRVMIHGSCVTLCMNDQMCEPRGADYYRPMPYCTMRALAQPFCRVCYCGIYDALHHSTGLQSITNVCPLSPPDVTGLQRTDVR